MQESAAARGWARRTAWAATLALGVATLLCVPFGLMWLEWFPVVRDSSGSLLYSLPDLFFVLLPVVAWLGRRRLPAVAEPPEPAGQPAILPLP